MKKWFITIAVLLLMVVCGGKDASAALWHEGNAQVVVLTESGDTIAHIAQDAVRVYRLANNIGRCTSALIREVHGVSGQTYRKNPKRYDRNFKAEQIYVLPDACITNLKKGVVAKTVEVPNISYSVQPSVISESAIEIATPTVEVSAAPDAYLVPTQSVQPEASEVAITYPTVTAPLPTIYTAYMPPSNLEVDDQSFRDGTGSKDRCVRNRMNEVVYNQQVMQDFPDPIIAQAVYANAQQALLSLFSRGCSSEQTIPNTRQDS